jgi:hypothetical protein
MSDCDDAGIKANAAQEHWGGLTGASGATIDNQRMMRDQRIQSAIWALSEARRIRTDPALMAEVRDWVAGKRHEFMLLLDDLGG